MSYDVAINTSGVIVSDGITEQADMEQRWRPSSFAVAQAKALLDAMLLADYVIVPMVQPGKVHGIWTIGQKVMTVPGALFLASKRDRYTTIPSYSWARNEALSVAERALGDQEGTVAYAAIDRDGDWAVFEY